MLHYLVFTGVDGRKRKIETDAMGAVQHRDVLTLLAVNLPRHEAAQAVRALL